MPAVWQSIAHLQLLALMGHLQTTNLPQSFASAAETIRWTLLDFRLPAAMHDLVTTISDQSTKQSDFAATHRRLMNATSVPPEILSDWLDNEGMSAGELQK